MSISLGDISFGLGPDTTRLKRAIQDIRDFGREVSNAARRQSDGARQAEAAMRRQEQATVSALMRVQNFQDALARAGAPESLGKSVQLLNQMTKSMTEGQLSALQYQRTMERFNVGMNNAQRQLRTYQDTQKAEEAAQREATTAAVQAEAQLRRQESALFSATQAVQRYTQAVQRAGAPAAYTAGAQSALGVLQKTLSDPTVDMTTRQRAIQQFTASMATSQNQLRSYNDTMSALSQLQRQNTTNLKSQEAEQLRNNAIIFQAEEAYKRLAAAIARAGAPTTIGGGAQAALNSLRGTLGTPNLSNGARQNATQAFQSAMNSARSRLSDFNGVAAPVNTLAQAMRQLSAASILVAGPLSGVSARVAVLAHAMSEFNLSTVAAIAGTAAGAYSFYKLGESAIDAAKKVQQVTLTLSAVYNSTAVAQTQLSYLMNVSDRAGVSFSNLSKQFSQIEAASKGTVLEGQRTRDIFEAITFAGAKLGLSSEEVNGALFAVQQMMSKGRLTAEETVRQLGDRLPGAMQTLASAAGVTTQKLQQMMRNGEVGLTFLVKFADEIKKRYGIDTTKSIDTIVAAENRFNNALFKTADAFDATVGVSSAYVKVLDTLSLGFSTIARNMDVVIKAAGAIALGLTFAFGEVIVNGVLALGRAILTASTAMVGFNTAVASNPLGLLAIVLARVAGAAFGAYAGYKLFDTVLGSTRQSYLTALPAVQSYIEAQQKQLTLTKNITDEYVKQLRAQQAQAYGAAADADYQLGQLKQKLEMVQKAGGNKDLLTSLRGQIDDASNRFDLATASAHNFDKALSDLTGIQQKQAALEAAPRKDPLKDLTNSQEVTLKKAREQIDRAKAQYNELYAAPAQQDFLKTQREITKSVEDFENTLQRSLGSNPQGKSQIAGLVAGYKAAITQLKEGQLAVQHMKSAFQALEGVFSGGLDTALGQFVDNIVEGKNAFTDFGNVAQSVLKDLLKTFITLAALNPLKNALFGTNYTVLGGTAGMGGLLADPMGGLMKLFAARGGVYGYDGQIQRFASGGVGGIAYKRTRVEFGEGSVPEAYVPVPSGKIPVQMSGGGGGQEVHIHTGGAPVETKKSRGPGGRERLDVFIKQMAVAAMMDDLTNGGPHSKGMESQFGLNRARGAY